MLKVSYPTIFPCVLFQALHPPWQEEWAFRHRCPARGVLLCRGQAVRYRRSSVQHAGSLVPPTHGEPPQPLGRALRRLEMDGFFSTTVTNPEPMGKQVGIVEIIVVWIIVFVSYIYKLTFFVSWVGIFICQSIKVNTWTFYQCWTDCVRYFCCSNNNEDSRYCN